MIMPAITQIYLASGAVSSRGTILFGFSLSHFACTHWESGFKYRWWLLKALVFAGENPPVFIRVCPRQVLLPPYCEAKDPLRLLKLNPCVWSLLCPHQVMNQNLTNLTTTALSGHSVHRELSSPVGFLASRLFSILWCKAWVLLCAV